MRQIKNQNLAQLLMQLRFAPRKKRQQQLDAAEKLLEIIDADKQYPFDFVCFRITGFKPKAPVEQQLIKADELAEDLRIFISKLSGQIAQTAAEQSQKVYTIEQLAVKFAVSTKTVHRWRKRGLIARKFIFENGRKHLGFLQSSVDKFVRKNPDLVDKAKNFARLTKTERQLIIKQAAALAADTRLSRHQIIKKIAAEIKKAHETVRYTIANYEKANLDKPVFDKSRGVISTDQSAEVYKLFQQGCSIKELMQRFNRSKSTIHRIINRRRAKTLLVKNIQFITSSEFSNPSAHQQILPNTVEQLSSVNGKKAEPLEVIKFPLEDATLPHYLQTLKQLPLLNRERELELFRRYNYLKFLATEALKRISLNQASGRELKKIENYLAQAETVKKIIIEANLRLVVSIASKHTTGGASLSDLISEGNFSLMQAVEKFDYTRGFRFATYASWTIAKEYARKTPAAKRTRTAKLANIERDLRTAADIAVVAIERAHQSLLQVINDELNERERYVILHHFGLTGSHIKKQTKTLKQIGDDLGMSKETVRQIELVALQKLRQSLSAKEFELLTG